jgi:hypothetical protein
MMGYRAVVLGLAFFSLAFAPFDFTQGKPSLAYAALTDQINQAYRQAYGKNPTVSEWTYWAGRVQRGEKKTYEALVGAMYFQKGVGQAPVAAAAGRGVPSLAAAGGFEVDRKYYPSSANPNALPDGTLIRSGVSGAVFYAQNGKRSWVTPNVLNRWLNENHFFKHDIVVTLSETDLARYSQVASVNPLYIGKVLVHPSGTQYFIDDHLRKRELPAGVRSALKIPGGNTYPTSAAHLREFRAGPKLTGDRYPGGMVVYTGPYHGGRFWRFQEAADGSIRKHLYLSDYIYEAGGNPDESHRAPAVTALFDKHGRGSNIERYPDGWTVGIGSNIYVVQRGSLRLITSAQLFAAMGYQEKYVRREHPEFLQRYPRGEPIRAYRNIVAAGVSSTKGAPQAAPNTAANLTKVRPAIRTLINQVNDIYLTTHGKDVTAAENKFWVDYLYNGEVNNRADLVAAMKRAAATGKNPSRTSRTVQLSSDKLKSHWFPYLFYFVHQQDPSGADTNYWYSRIHAGDRDSIEKLGGTIQWVKENLGATRR